MASPELIAQLKRHEGLSLKPYRDSMGLLTIGYGRNLDDVGISEHEAEMLLAADAAGAEAALFKAIPWAKDLDPVRQDVLINMAFNMGINKLLGFVNTLHYVSVGDYARAAEGMLNSLWARQVKSRAIELAKHMETGVR